MTVCTVDGCGRQRHARTLCHRHYDQWWRGRPIYAPHPYSNHRYCTCYGDDIPTPDPNGMCPACLRLVERRSTA